MMAHEPDKATVQRLANLGDWEMYRVAFEDSDDPVCTITLRPRKSRGKSADAFEYVLFPQNEPEPAATAVKARAHDDDWSDEAREEAILDVLGLHAKELPPIDPEVEFELADDDDEDDDD